MRILVDTNILIRLADSASDLHQITSNAVQELNTDGHQLVMVPQNLYEFWSVATRTIAANGLEYSPQEAQDFIQRFERLFLLLRDERAIFEVWLDLVGQHKICGVKSFDTRLVASMKRHGITHLLTFNGSDFKTYTEITVLDPANVASGTA